VRIVGVVVGPASVNSDTRLGEGATMTLAALGRASGVDPPFPVVYAVRFADGVDLTAGIASLRPAFGSTIVRPVTTADIESLTRVRALPLIIAGLVAVLAVSTVGLSVLAAVRRQRRELAVLKTLGFTGAQIREAVAVQATTYSLLALVFGIPLGVVLGRWVWRLATDALGIVVAPSLPLALLVLVPAAIVSVNALAALPGRVAARIQPAVALRAD
jgi:predicted lysophospholipase L1 biosynthesis ABC-type transport system permease subunit